MRLIDAEALAGDLMERWNTADEQAEKLIIAVLANVVTPILAGQPTVDAVPREKYDRLKENAEILSKACDEMEYVVRCRDCKHRSKSGLCNMWSVFGTVTTDDDMYCSYGERGEADD